MPPVLRSQQPEVLTVPKPKAGTKVGFVVPILTEPGETSMAAGTKKAAGLLDMDLSVVDANLDLSKQLQLADDQLSQGFKGIITIALVPDTLNAFYARADQQKVPNVTVFSDRPASIQEEGGAPGREAAQMILDKHPEGARGVILSDTPAPVIVDRENGFKEVVGYKDKFGGSSKPDSKIKVLDFQRNLKETLDDARRIAADMIQRNPDLQFIWCTNDVGGQGAALAAEAAGKDILVFGMNGDPAAVNLVKKGTLTATWDANQNRMGMRAVAHIAQWVDSGKPPETVRHSFTRITKDNVADYIPWPERAE
jgi:ribose transport system substrate-binding protein